MADVSEKTPENEETTAPQGWRRDAVIVATYLGAAVLGGIAGGFLIGGIGSRVAMFVLRVTTGDSVVGLISDDGFEIGRLSTSTFFLVLFGTALGAAVGLLYLLSRPWIPPPLRTPSFGLLGGLVGGSGIVHADGIDFTVLEPVWLAVVMFVALPAAGAAAIAEAVERLIVRRSTAVRPQPWFLFLPLLGLAALGPLGLALVVALPLGIALNQKVPLVSIWTSQIVMWIGRALLVVWGVWAAIALAKDLSGIF